MIPLTKKEEKNHNKQKVCYICRKEFNTDDSDKKYYKVKIIVIIQENIEVLLMISVT